MMTQIDALLDKLRRQPEVAALLAEEVREKHDVRVRHAQERDHADAQLLALDSAWQPKIAASEARLQKAREALRTAETAHGALMADYRAVRIPLDRRCEAARAFVYQSAPAEAFERFRDRCMDALRKTYRASDVVRELNIAGRFNEPWDNRRSVAARAAAIEQSLRDMDGLRHEALTPPELDARFEALAADWPEVEARPARFLR